MPPRSAKKGVAKKLTSPAAATKADPASESPPAAEAAPVAEGVVTLPPEAATPTETAVTPLEAVADGVEVTTTVSVVTTEVVEERVVMEVTTEEVQNEEEVDPEVTEEDEAVATMDLDEAVKNVEQKPADAVDGAGDGQHSGGNNNGTISGGEESEDEEDPSMLMDPLLTEKKVNKEFEIFVGKLDKEAVEDDLVKVFGVFGEIKSVRIVKHPSTQKSKGFGFVRYVSMENARKALAELKDGVEVKGKQVKISASNDNDTLYLGNICKTWTKDNVMDALKSYGVDQLESIVLPDDSKKDGKIKGFALLQYGSHAEAVAAFQRLRKPDAIFGFDKSAKVAFSNSLQPNDEAMSQIKSVYFEGITESWDEDKVRELCKQYGEIEKVRLSRDFTRAKKKDYGFVEFATHESAVACVEGLNNTDPGEGEVKLKANLAKPKNKGRVAKQVLRGGFPVKKDGEVSEEAGKTKKKNVKSNEVVTKNVKSNEVGNKGKDQSKDVKGSQPSKAENKDKPLKSEGKTTPSKKRGQRGVESSTNDRPAKKSRTNSSGQRRGGRPAKAFGNPRTGYVAPPLTFAPRYALPPPSYQGHAYAGASVSNRRHSDLEPHGGYLPAARGVHSSYRTDPRRAAAYASQPSSGSGYPRAVVHSSYPGYQNYPGYEGGYPYPSSGAYDPRRGYY